MNNDREFILLDDFTEPNQPEQESFAQSIPRHAARTGLRVAEAATGLPGDILSFLNDFVGAPIASKITGNEAIPYEDLTIAKALPTSSQLRKRTEKNKYLKSQTSGENIIDNMVADATSLFLPGGTLKKVNTALKSATKGEMGAKGLSALATSVGSNLSKEFVTDLTSDEKKGAYAYLGTMALLSLIDKKGAAKAISEGYAPLEAKAAKLSPVNAGPLETQLNNLKAKVSKGTIAPSEKFVIDEVDAVLSKIKNGKITPEELWASKRSLNEKLTKIVYEAGDKGTKVRAKALAGNINGYLKNALYQTKQQDPKFYKELAAWDAAYGTMAKSKPLGRWIENNLHYSAKTAGLGELLGQAGLTGIAAKAAGLNSGLAVGAVYKGGQILYRVAKSPKLAKHYAKTLAAASAENASLFNKELKSLDKAIQEEDGERRFDLLED
jgi:hypothetical protein